MKNLINLQLFADGGAGDGGASGGEGAATAGVNGAPTAAQGGEDLSKVSYGISINSEKGTANPTNTDTAPVSTEDKSKIFENMIKKGGEFADEFNKHTQTIINKRFKETKGLQERLAKQDGIMSTLATKYGVDANDADAIQKAIDADDSLYEEAAFKEGLTVPQYREKIALERENQRLKEAEEQRQIQTRSEEIYANWIDEGGKFAERYGLNNFDFAAECENPDFTNLLRAGISVESAYKAVHFDDMVGGAMAKTAEEVRGNLARSIQSRASRPAENGLVSSNTSTMKTDVNKLTNADIDEVLKRVRAGEIISFG